MRTSLPVVIFLLTGVSCQWNLTQDVADELIRIMLGIQQAPSDCGIPIFQQADFYLYTRSNPSGVLLDPNNPVQVDPNKNVVVLIHGWMDTPLMASTPTQNLKNSYLTRYDCNVIIVDWSLLGHTPYPTAYCGLPGIARIVTTFLCTLNSQLNITMKTTHLVGQSLGAQMTGFVGTFLREQCEQDLDRITGLDPAGPFYQDTSVDRRLDASDASFVDVLHTNEGFAGYYGNCGDVDFHANCGVTQPGCPEIDISNIAMSLITAVSCSHIRATSYWIESVLGGFFLSKSCTNCPSHCTTNTLNPSYVRMGEDCPRNPPSNNYYTPTNAATQFAQGCTPYPQAC